MQVCFAASSLGELRSQLGDKYLEYNVIAIDEAQFLPDLLEFCTTAADIDRKQIVIAGLDGDFKRQRFGQVRLRLCALPLKNVLGGPVVTIHGKTDAYIYYSVCLAGVGHGVCSRQRDKTGGKVCVLQ